jgi:hypothetical protein
MNVYEEDMKVLKSGIQAKHLSFEGAVYYLNKWYKCYYNLSQEEIDQLVKELKDSYEAPKTITVPGFSDGYAPPEPKPSGCIFHEWVVYTGLFESFDHCKKCGEKKK